MKHHLFKKIKCIHTLCQPLNQRLLCYSLSSFVVLQTKFSSGVKFCRVVRLLCSCGINTTSLIIGQKVGGEPGRCYFLFGRRWRPLAKLLRLLFCYLFHYWWLCLFWTPTARKHCHGKSWQALIKINLENQKVHHSAGFGLNAALSDLTQRRLGGRWCAPHTCEHTLMYNLGMHALLSLSAKLVDETNIIFTATSNLWLWL